MAYLESRKTDAGISLNLTGIYEGYSILWLFLINLVIINQSSHLIIYLLGFTGGLRKYRSSSNRNSNASSRDRNQHESPNVLPHAVKARLQSLFTEIETEFSALYQENLQLRTKISSLEKGQYHINVDDYKIGKY